MSTKYDYSNLDQAELVSALKGYLKCIALEKFSKQELLTTINNLNEIGFSLDKFIDKVSAYSKSEEFINRSQEEDNNGFDLFDYEIP